jgi:hypothetical protein
MMMMKNGSRRGGRRAGLLGILLMTSAVVCGAQPASSPPPHRLPAGARARLTSAQQPGKMLYGTVLRSDAEGVTLALGGADPYNRREVTLPFTSLRHLVDGLLLQGRGDRDGRGGGSAPGRDDRTSCSRTAGIGPASPALPSPAGKRSAGVIEITLRF